ncbi:MAG: hypothetical protein WB511_14295 [Nitrososphaeraceae archaeon]
MYEKNLHGINVLVVQRQYALGLGIHGAVLTKNQKGQDTNLRCLHKLIFFLHGKEYGRKLNQTTY